MSRLAAIVALGIASCALSACGLQPLYVGGANGVVAQGLAGIDVPAIPDRQGWLMRNALVDRFGVDRFGVDRLGGSGAAPRYRLDVVLDDNVEALGLLTDDTIGRERRTLRARYQLIDLASGTVLVDATAGSDAGIDVVASEYATIAAEQTALENLVAEVANQITARLSRTLREAP